MVTSAHSQCLYHITPARLLSIIASDGLQPSIGPRSQSAGETQAYVHCFTSFDAAAGAYMNWFREEFDEDEKLALIAVNLPPAGDSGWECAYAVTLRPHLLWVVSDDLGAEKDLRDVRDRDAILMSSYMEQAARMIESPVGSTACDRG